MESIYKSEEEFLKNYDSSSFDVEYANWNPDFMRVNINPICILKFNDKHALTIQTRFSR